MILQLFPWFFGLEQNRILAYHHKFHMETVGWGYKSLFKWSWSHDQDGGLFGRRILATMIFEKKMIDALSNIIPKSIIEVLNRLENDEDNQYLWKLMRNQDSRF